MAGRGGAVAMPAAWVFVRNGGFHDATLWTEAEQARLADLVAEGLSSSQIATILQRTKMSVIGRCRRTGLRLRRPAHGGRDWARWAAAVPSPPVVSRETPPPPPPEPVQPPEVIMARLPKPLPPPRPDPVQREARGCTWPTSDDKPWTFCEAPTEGFSPYCPEHKAMARGNSVGRPWRIGVPG